MNRAGVLAGCLLILSIAGTPPPVLRSRTKVLRPSAYSPPKAQLFAQEIHTAKVLLSTGHYHQAALEFQGIAKRALTAGDSDLAARLTSDAGACEFALHQYQPALESFLKARSLAEAPGNASLIAALDANIASVYSEMGEVESATRWIETSLAHIRGEERRRFLPKLEIQMAVLRAEMGDLPAASRLFRQGIEHADEAGDLETYALGCNRMGEAFLLAGDAARAEPPLLEAFHIRKLHHLPLDTSYHRLGRLRLAQGDLTSASNLLDRAVELATCARNLMPAWDIYYSRGRVRLEQGRLKESIDDLRKAVRLARDWRWSLPAAETARISAQSKLDQVYSAFIEATGQLFLRSADPRFAEEGFAAEEENRAASVQSLVRISNVHASSMPAAWWEAVSALERAEMAALPERTAERRETILNARADLARVEAENGVSSGIVGPAARPPRNLIQSVQTALGPDMAIFSFHLADEGSWLWAIDADGLVLRRLPSRADVDRLVQSFRRTIRPEASEATRTGAELFDTLFGSVPPRFERRSRWLLSLDQNLFDVPIAALIERRGRIPLYVAERHVTQVIPGVLPWLGSVERQRPRHVQGSEPPPTFLGVGDAIYNTADPRMRLAPSRSGPTKSTSPFSLFAGSRRGENDAGLTLALPRLAASGAELSACAAAWGGSHTLLEGTGATRARLIAELGRYPAVIHFATHFLASAADSHYLIFEGEGIRRQPDAEEMIALSVNGDGQTELVTAAEIAHWPVRADLVTLSGCRSAGGAALPGAGLLGLTRAWLSAGARSVIGSLWETPDESGAVFASLYRHLSQEEGADPAAALNSAQKEMIRAGGWQSQPRYWGAYFVVTHE